MSMDHLVVTESKKCSRKNKKVGPCLTDTGAKRVTRAQTSKDLSNKMSKDDTGLSHKE